MFDIGFGELLFIAIVALLVLGPDRLPTTLRAVGRALREFRRATNELRSQIDLDGTIRDVKKELDAGPLIDEAPRGRRPPMPDTTRIYPSEGPDLEDVLPEGSPYPPVTPVVAEEDDPPPGEEKKAP